MLVNPLMVGVSDCLEIAGTKPLTGQEIAGGTRAFSALCAQYMPGKFTDARFLVAMWVLGTILPRLLMWLQEQKKKKPEVVKVTGQELAAAAATEKAAA